MRLSPIRPAAAILAALLAIPALDAAPLAAQGRDAREMPEIAMAAPATARSGPTWLIRSPDLEGPRVRIALGVSRADTVAVHVTEGDVVLDGEYAAAVAAAWADSAIALLRATDERAPAGEVGRTPVAVGRAGISFQLEVMGAGAARRFAVVSLDSLGVNAVMAELDAAAVLLLVTQMRELAGYAIGKGNAEKILYALRPPKFEFQVEKPAIAEAGNPPPRYPETMRSQRISGEVLVQFVVDTTGRADLRTFKILRSTHPDFAWAVRLILGRYRFLPAETEGRKVPMYVQMPFKFNIAPGPIGDPFPDPRRPRIEGWP